MLEVRIVGICPIRLYPRDPNNPDEDMLMKKLFWIYYPEARSVMANHMAFNPRNDAAYFSFDDIFLKRFFSSFIFQESNTYNNRQINQYALGVEALMESERIKKNIFNFELDMWEY